MNPLTDRLQREAREKFRCDCGDERCEADVVRFSFSKMDALIAHTIKETLTAVEEEIKENLPLSSDEILRLIATLTSSSNDTQV